MYSLFYAVKILIIYNNHQLYRHYKLDGRGKDFAQYGANSFSGRGIERLTYPRREIRLLQIDLKAKELNTEILKTSDDLLRPRADKEKTNLWTHIDIETV